jgi:hypothetical protein
MGGEQAVLWHCQWMPAAITTFIRTLIIIANSCTHLSSQFFIPHPGRIRVGVFNQSIKQSRKSEVFKQMNVCMA